MVELEKLEAASRRSGSQVTIDKHSHVFVVLLLAVSVHMVVTGKPTDVAVEIRTDVIQLVEDRHQLFAEIVVKEPRQVESQQVEHFTAIQHDLLDAPALPTNGTFESPLFEPERRQLGLQSMLHLTSRLSKADRDFAHSDMVKFGDAVRYVLTEDTHCGAEVKDARCHAACESVLTPIERQFRGTEQARLDRTCIDRTRTDHASKPIR